MLLMNMERARWREFEEVFDGDDDAKVSAFLSERERPERPGRRTDIVNVVDALIKMGKVIPVEDMLDCEAAAVIVNGQVFQGIGDDLTVERPPAPEVEAVYEMEPSDAGDAPASEDALDHVDDGAPVEVDFDDVVEAPRDDLPDELNFDDPDDLPDVG